jgi:hypothetical protein
VSTHAICDKEELVSGITGVLIGAAVFADVTGGIRNSFYGQGLLPQLKGCCADTNRGALLDSCRGNHFSAINKGSVGGVQVLKYPVLAN